MVSGAPVTSFLLVAEDTFANGAHDDQVDAMTKALLRWRYALMAARHEHVTLEVGCFALISGAVRLVINCAQEWPRSRVPLLIRCDLSRTAIQ